MGEQVVVSVICTCFNKGKWIRQALDSVIAQKTSFPFEVIVVDDASTDDSLLVIEQFAGEHPDAVRVIAHEANKGISATWPEVCREARGAYIARIDGDDYWTDDCKLQDQYDALSGTPDSRWCCTDFDMVDSDGGLICANALQSGTIATVDSYEQMLAVKGLTNSSTWLVDAQLMREANECVRADAADDTFSIQLELFRRTRLLRIERSLCAMRVHTGSDSRPMTKVDAQKRFAGLMDQQLEFLERYDDADFREMTRHLIRQDAEKDLNVFERDRIIEWLNAQLAEKEELNRQLQEKLDSSPLSAAKSAAHALARRVKRG